MSDIDTKLYDAMGQRFSVIKVVGSEGEWYEVTGVPEIYHNNNNNNTIVAKNLKYSEARGIVKLLGGYDG